ncbi:MAG: hypothetical protein ABSF43_08850 [Rectinemataceae bacterium]
MTVTKELAVPLSRNLAERQLAFLSAFDVAPIDLGIVLSAVKIRDRYGISHWDGRPGLSPRPRWPLCASLLGRPAGRRRVRWDTR